jgi:hypothetical protein
LIEAVEAEEEGGEEDREYGKSRETKELRRFMRRSA